MVVISDLASLCLKDEVPPNASVETAALLAWITEGPEMCTHHTLIVIIIIIFNISKAQINM